MSDIMSDFWFIYFQSGHFLAKHMGLFPIYAFKALEMTYWPRQKANSGYF